MEIQGSCKVITHPNEAREINDLHEHFLLLHTASELMEVSVADAATVSRSLSAKHQAELTAALVDRSEEIVAQFAELTEKFDRLLKELQSTEPPTNKWGG